MGFRAFIMPAELKQKPTYISMCNCDFGPIKSVLHACFVESVVVAMLRMLGASLHNSMMYALSPGRRSFRALGLRFDHKPAHNTCLCPPVASIQGPGPLNPITKPWKPYIPGGWKRSRRQAHAGKNALEPQNPEPLNLKSLKPSSIRP